MEIAVPVAVVVVMSGLLVVWRSESSSHNTPPGSLDEDFHLAFRPKYRKRCPYHPKEERGKS